MRYWAGLRTRRLVFAWLPCMVALVLTSCGGGGSNVRTPPPPAPPPPTGIGFTPTISNDASLTQINPPVMVARPAPLTFDSSLGRHMTVINAGASLAAGARGAGVGIGVLDSGVRTDHPQLSPRVVYNGFYLNSPPNDPSVDYVLEHGTWVALTAAGSASGRWPGGPAPSANIVSGRFLSDNPPVDDGSGQGNAISTADARGFAEFLDWAHDDLYRRGARIMNNSWGGVYFVDEAAGAAAMATGFTDFIHNKNGLVVFANGNYGGDPRYQADPSDTASLPTLAPSFGLERGWLTVAALDPDNPTQLLPFSQYCGRAMNYCLSAPGKVAVVGASPSDNDEANTDENYAYFVQGTSFSAPLVSGAAAAVWSVFPYFNNDLVRQTLLGTAKDVGTPGVDNVFGWGVLDVGKAINGPGTFAWGDVAVSFNGMSVWRNAIDGGGGLIKRGSGTLTLTQHGDYTGNTRVEAGALDVRQGLRSNVFVASGAKLWGAGNFGGDIDNNGLFLAGAGTPASISGNFRQGASGNLGVWLGSPVQVAGTAAVDGTVSILGVKSNYITTSKETLLTANGGVTGVFDKATAAPNVFLDASLSYDPNNVFLDIKRIDVTRAIAGQGFGAAAVSGAQRMEAAMTAIDSQLGGGGSGISKGFIDGAGMFQNITSMDWANLSLRSLAGQVHAANAAMTNSAVEAGRRAVSDRLSDLSALPHVSGVWVRDLGQEGDLTQAGFDALSLGSSGVLLGIDTRSGGNTTMGVAFSRLQQSGDVGVFGDSSRGLQHQTQLYLGWQRDRWQMLAQLGLGGFDRYVARNLLIGNRFDRVGTRVGGSYSSLSAELGRHFDVGTASLMPYVGATRLTVRNDGFAEDGAEGFGLRANAWISRRSHAYAGLLGARAWRQGDMEVKLDVRAEWQRTLASGGDASVASYVGVDQWLPLQGISLAPHDLLLGLGLSGAIRETSVLRFDLTRQSSPSGTQDSVRVQWRRAF